MTPNMQAVAPAGQNATEITATGPTGNIVTVPLDWPLPDGTRLLDDENSHLLNTILRVFEIERDLRQEGSSAYSHTSAIEIVRELRRLVYWMKLNSIDSFRNVTFRQARRYLDSYCKGLDFHIQATSRLAAHFDHQLMLGGPARVKSIPLTEHLELCHIPSSFLPRLPKCRVLYHKASHGIAFEKQDRVSDPMAMTVAAIYGHAAEIERLWTHREKLNDTLSFNPVPETPHLYAKKRGRTGKSTRTIPPELGATYLAGCIHWIFDIGPELISLSRVVKSKAKNRQHVLLEDTPEGQRFNEISKHWGWKQPLVGNARNGRTGIEFRSAMNTYLLSACFSVILGFTARRGIEVSSLKCNCISGNRESGYWITSYIGKRGTIEATPCPEIVVHAVRTILAMYGKTETSDEPLFRMRDRTHVISGVTRENINEFAKFIDADALPGMREPWVYAKHQFRRLYAIVYVWRYEFPCLASLQFHLRHLHLWMTRIYYSDIAIEEIVDEQRRLTVWKLKSILTGAVTAKGILGKSIERALSRLGSIDLVDEEKLEKKLEDLATRRKIMLKATPWGFCGATGSPSHLKRSACHSRVSSERRVDPYVGGPLGSSSSEEICAGCIFHMTDDTRQEHWERVEREIEASANASKFTMLGDALRKRLSKVSSFVRNNFFAGREKSDE